MIAHTPRSFHLLNFKGAFDNSEVPDCRPYIREVIKANDALPSLKDRDRHNIKLHSAFAFQYPFRHQDFTHVLVPLDWDNLKTGLNSSSVDISFNEKQWSVINGHNQHTFLDCAGKVKQINILQNYGKSYACPLHIFPQLINSIL